jgi:hypothetical protein
MLLETGKFVKGHLVGLLLYIKQGLNSLLKFDIKKDSRLLFNTSNSFDFVSTKIHIWHELL